MIFGYRDADTTSFRNLAQHVFYGSRPSQFPKSELELQFDSGASIVTRYPDGLRFRNADVRSEWDGLLREIDLKTYQLVFDQNFGQELISGPELCFQLKRRFGVPFGDHSAPDAQESLEDLEEQLRGVQTEVRNLQQRRAELISLFQEHESSELPADFLDKQRSTLESRVENQRQEWDRLRAQAYELENEIELAVQAVVPVNSWEQESMQKQLGTDAVHAADPHTRDQNLDQIDLQIEKWKSVQQDVSARLADLKSELGSPKIGEFDATFEDSRALIRESESKLLDLLDVTDADSQTNNVLKDLISLNHGICDSLSQVQDLWRDRIIASEIKELDHCLDGLESYLKRLTERRIQLTGDPQQRRNRNCRCRTHREPAKVDLRYIERLKIEHDQLLEEIENASHRLKSSESELNSLPRDIEPGIDLAQLKKEAQSVEKQVRQLEAEAEELVERIRVASQPMPSGSHLLSLISNYAEELTNGNVSRVFIADDGGGLVVVDSEGNESDMRDVEFVQRSQIRLAIALGCAELLSEAGYSVPLVLEDAFVAMDERDLDLAIRCLNRFSKQNAQVILLTNNRFVRDYVLEKGLPCLDLPDRYSGESLPVLPQKTERHGDNQEHRAFQSRIDWIEVNRYLDVAAMDQYGTDSRSLSGNQSSARYSLESDDAPGVRARSADDDDSRSTRSSTRGRRDSRNRRLTQSLNSRSRETQSRASTGQQAETQERTSRSRSRSSETGSNRRSHSTRQTNRTSSSRDRNRSRSNRDQSFSVRNTEAPGSFGRSDSSSHTNTRSEQRSEQRSERVDRRADSRVEQSETTYKFYLNLSSDVESAPTIGPKTAERLAKVGIVTVSDLLEADPEWVATELNHRRIKAADVALWQHQARLVCQVPNLRGHDAQILVACGIQDSAQLATMNATSLFEIVGPFAKSKEGQKLIRGATEPDSAEVEDWIQWARHQRPLDRAA